MILGLNSAEKIEKASNGEAFKIQNATTAIEAFNLYLEKIDHPELALNSESADLALITMLKLGADKIEATLSPNKGKPRPGRLHSLARAYKDFLTNHAVSQEAKRE